MSILYVKPRANECPASDLQAVYDKLQPFRRDYSDAKIIHLKPKVDIDVMDRHGFLSVSETVEPSSDLDRAFVQDPDSFEKQHFYGLHAYGGYHGCFKPDLKEVIDLVHTQVMATKATRVFVTTELWPVNNINFCFDAKADMHRARTTIYTQRPQGAAKRTAEEQVVDARSDQQLRKRAKCEIAVTDKHMTPKEHLVQLLKYMRKPEDITEENAEATYRSLRFGLDHYPLYQHED